MINVDGLLNDGDEDFSHEFKIEDLNKILIENEFINRFNDIIGYAIKAAGKIDVTQMEIVIAGGTTRIPKFQQVLTSILQNNKADIQTLNLTLNMDECVSTGCSYYGAILHNEISYNVSDKYSGIVMNSCNIKNIKAVAIKLSQIKNFMYRFSSLESRINEIDNGVLLYYIKCYKYYVQFYIILHQNDLNSLGCFIYIHEELKEVMNLLGGYIIEGYKTSVVDNIEKPPNYGSIFTSLIEEIKNEEVKISKIDDLSGLLVYFNFFNILG